MSFAYMVDLAKLDETVRDIGTFDARLDAHVKALDAVVARLQDEWHGEAALAQKDAHDRWTRGVDQMRTALARMKDAAAVAHANYESAATTNQTMWKQVR